jgi:hypothetical protein
MDNLHYSFGSATHPQVSKYIYSNKTHSREVRRGVPKHPKKESLHAHRQRHKPQWQYDSSKKSRSRKMGPYRHPKTMHHGWGPAHSHSEAG